MYERAIEVIHQGLGFGARLLLGIVASAFGVVMFLTANPEHRVGFYGFGVFCMLMAATCFTSGRIRQFIGSVVGCAIFLTGIWYLEVEIHRGAPFPAAPRSPRLLTPWAFYCSSACLVPRIPIKSGSVSARRPDPSSR